MLPVCSGVPQGYILGPLPFCIFIDDLSDVLTVKFHFYADDLQIYDACTRDDFPSCVTNLNSNLQRILEWSELNSLKLNASKTQDIVFSPAQYNAFNFIDFPCVVNNVRITYADEVKNLGMVFVRNLDFVSNTNAILNRILLCST